MAISSSIIVLFMASVAVVNVASGREKKFSSYIDQINHIRYPGTFNQTLLQDSDYWGGDGYPIFFYPGGDGPINDSYANAGWIQDLAKEFRAMVVFAEHRYFGKSLPFGPSSYEGVNIGLLSLDNILGDFAYIAFALKVDKAPSSKIIAIGGGYSGQLALYLRLKYPNIFDGSHVSSGPILLDDPSYFNKDIFFPAVSNIFEQESRRCRDAVAQAFKDTHDYKIAKRDLNLCSEIETGEDYMNMVSWARDLFVKAAMYNYDQPTEVPVKLPAKPVNTICKTILSEKTPSVGLGKALGILYKPTAGKDCYDPKKDYTTCSDPIGCGTGVTARAHYLLRCLDLNTILGSDSKTSMFPIIRSDSEVKEYYCFHEFHFRRKQSWISVKHFGKNLASATNVTFFNGGQDPWFDFMLQEHVTKTTAIFNAPNGKFMHDLRTPQSSDPEDVKRARAQIKAEIAKWLK